MPAGRSSAYDTAYCDEVIEAYEAKRIKYPIVYGLCAKNGADIFYIGSTVAPEARFRAYARGAAHGNKALKRHLELPFKVLVLARPEEAELRQTEWRWIAANKYRLVNIVTDAGAFAVSSAPWVNKFLVSYRNRFRNDRAKAFAEEMKARVAAMSGSELAAANDYFEQLLSTT